MAFKPKRRCCKLGLQLGAFRSTRRSNEPCRTSPRCSPRWGYCRRSKDPVCQGSDSAKGSWLPCLLRRLLLCLPCSPLQGALRRPRLAGPLASPRPRTSGAGHLGAFNAAEAPHGWTSSWRPRRPPLPRCARPLFGVSRGRAMPHRPVCSARHGGGAGGRRAPGSSCVSPCV